MSGFKPVQNIGGAPYTGKTQLFAVSSGHASLLAVGDLVRISGTADSTGLAEVDAATAGSLITGAITAILPNFSNLEQSGLPISTAGKVMVTVGRDVLFEAPTASAVAITDVGGNSDIVATEATASGGLVQSNMTVQTSSAIAGTAQIRIEGLKDGGTAVGSTIYCRINESTLNTVGI